MEIKRLFDIPRRQLDRFPKEDALTAKENGKWTPYSTRYFVDMIDRVSYGLLASGIGKGDKIAIISANRPEWNFVDHGMMQIAAVNVPIYTTLSEPEIKFILNDCGAKWSLPATRISIKDRGHPKRGSDPQTGLYLFTGHRCRSLDRVGETGRPANRCFAPR